MLRLTDLPHDLLKKIFKQYLKHSDGAAVLWRLVCAELRDAVRAEPHASWIQGMCVSVKLVQMMRRWVSYCGRDGTPTPRWNRSFATRIWESDLLEALVRYDNAPVLVETMKEGWVKRTGIFSGNLQEANRYICLAAASGALDSLKLLVHKGMKLDKHTLDWAVQYGHANVVEFHLEIQKKYEQLWRDGFLGEIGPEGLEWRFPHPIRGAGYCAMDLTKQWEPLWALKYIMEHAIRGGHLYVTTLLMPFVCKEEGQAYEVWPTIFHHATEYGQLKILQWAAAISPATFSDCFERVVFEARRLNHLDILEWLESGP